MIINLEELELGGKKVLIRQDLNVPIKAGVVTSDKRIKASLPTIEMAMKQGAKVMLMSHRGRPTEGEASDEFTLQPVADRLSELPPNSNSSKFIIINYPSIFFQLI
jgi:phosphoglycerate kinase